MTHTDPTTPRRKWFTLKRRRWAYGVLSAIAVALVVQGVASAEQVAAWLGVGAALLGVTGLAIANPTRDE